MGFPAHSPVPCYSPKHILIDWLVDLLIDWLYVGMIITFCLSVWPSVCYAIHNSRTLWHMITVAGQRCTCGPSLWCLLWCGIVMSCHPALSRLMYPLSLLSSYLTYDPLSLWSSRWGWVFRSVTALLRALGMGGLEHAVACDWSTYGCWSTPWCPIWSP